MMFDDEKVIYKLDDEISFRKCSLFNEAKLKRGDCTNYTIREENWKNYYYCDQGGIHFHCTKHPEIEFEIDNSGMLPKLICPKCKNSITVNFSELKSQCLRLVNREYFKDAKLVRLDDWYVPEIKQKIETPSDYWMKADVKTDKDGDTIIVLYVGHKGDTDKSQFFIKPEKLQLASDHKDLDPATILSKIEVTLKNRTLIHKFDEDQD